MPPQDFPNLAIQLAQQYVGLVQPQVDAILKQLESQTPIAIACSGGADSVFTTLLMWGVYPHLRQNIHILHFNHRIRGAISDDDERFTQALAQALGVGYATEKADIDPTLSYSEEQLRTLRHRFFQDKLRSLQIPYLILGHNQDDVAETVLMRLSRGSSLRGLCAPRPVQQHDLGRITYLRPLLNLTARWIRERLKALKIKCCEDQTNAQPDYYRNQLRLNVIPAWRACNQDHLQAQIAQCRTFMQEDDDAIEDWLDRLCHTASIQLEMPVDWRLLVGYPQALHRRLLWRFLTAHRLNQHLARSAIEKIVLRLSHYQPFKMSCGDWFLVFNGIELSKKPKSTWSLPFGPYQLELGQPLDLPDLAQLMLVQANRESLAAYLNQKQTFETTIYLPAQPEPLIVRNWQYADAYQPLGLKGTQKLQDAFVNRKIKLQHRHQKPVVLSQDGSILWCPGLIPSQKTYISLDVPPPVIWQLTYQPRSLQQA